MDDESSIATLISEVLRAKGAVASLKTSAIEALTQPREIEESNQHNKYDLIISDQIMPSMTGLELATQVMKINPALPFALCSGSIIGLENCPANVARVLQQPINNQR